MALVQNEISTELQVALYSTVGLVSLITNSLIFLVIGTNKKMHTKSNFLLLSLALTDLLITIFGIPVQLWNLIDGKKDRTNETTCNVLGFLILVPFLATNLNMTLIAAHRYFLVVKSNTYRRVFTNRNIVIYVIVVWMIGVSLATPPLVGWGQYTYNINRAHCMIDWAHSKGYMLLLQLFSYSIPMTVMCFSYYKIFKENYNSRQRLGSGGVENRRRKRSLHEMRLTVMLVVVVCCFFVMYLPYAVLIILEGHLKMTQSQIFSFFAMLFAYCNGMLNFWIYAGMSTQFRIALLKLLHKLCRKFLRDQKEDMAFDEGSSLEVNKTAWHLGRTLSTNKLSAIDNNNGYAKTNFLDTNKQTVLSETMDE